MKKFELFILFLLVCTNQITFGYSISFLNDYGKFNYSGSDICLDFGISKPALPPEIYNNGVDDDGNSLIDYGDNDYLTCSLSSCTDSVILISQASNTATGSGIAGLPSITGLNIPGGNNRIVFILANFEREHCQSGDNCTYFNFTGAGLGDNFAAPSFLAGNPQITARFIGPSSTLDRQNPLNFPDGDLRFGTQYSYPDPPGTSAAALISRESYFIALYESEINAILGGASGQIDISLPDVNLPLDNADDAILVAFVFANVEQSNAGIVRCGLNIDDQFFSISSGGTVGNFTTTISNLDNGQEPDEEEDGFLVFGFNGTGLPTDNGGYETISGFNEVYEEVTNNGNGNFTIFNEGDGFSVSAQFRNGPSSGIIDDATIQSSAFSGLTVNGGMLFAFTLESCPTEICNNAIDDDGDGLIDCADNDCCCAKAPTLSKK